MLPVIFLIFWNLANQVSKQPVQIVAAIQAGDLQKAYNMTSPKFKANTNVGQFKLFADNFMKFESLKSFKFSFPSIANKIGTVKEVITLNNDETKVLEYKLIQEDNSWKVVSIEALPAQLPDSPEIKAIITEEQEVVPVFVGMPDIENVINSNINTNSITTPVNSLINNSTILVEDKKEAPPAIVDIPLELALNDPVTDIKVNEKFNSEGIVDDSKGVFTTLVPEIYVSVWISEGDVGQMVKALLTYLPMKEYFGPVSSEIVQPGKNIQSFSFTKPKNNWKLGNYVLTITMPDGTESVAKFSVK